MPVLTSPTAATSTIGQSFTYTPTFTNSPTSITATGLPAGLSIDSATGVISGTPTTGGTYTVSLSATNAVGTNIISLTIRVDLAQTVTFGALANKTYGDAPFTVSATASSGLAPSFSIVSGPATISGSTVTITGAGTVVLSAAQAGNATYAAATPVQQSFTVAANATFTGYYFTTLAGVASVNGATDGTGSAARFNSLSGVAVDRDGNVYVADLDNHTIRKVTSAGVVTTLAGSAGQSGSTDGTGSAARFNGPHGVAVDDAGNVYVSELANHTIRKVTSVGVVSTLAGSAGLSGSTDGAGSAARFNSPRSVAVDGSGDVYVADSGNHTIRKVTSAGVVSTLAGSAGISGSTNGTGGAARFDYPSSVAVDGARNVYVAEANNNTIRKVTSSGVVTTLAGLAGSSGSANGTGSSARFNFPFGVAVDRDGNVYVADYFNHTIRKVTSAGVVTTQGGLAGTSGSADGAGSAARFQYPRGMAVDGVGNIYVADAANSTIRKGLFATAPVLSSPTAMAAGVGQAFTYTPTYLGAFVSFSATVSGGANAAR